jgi:predicted RNA-binding protein (virulence factor B family)
MHRQNPFLKHAPYCKHRQNVRVYSRDSELNAHRNAMAELGKRNQLTVLREATPGIYLDGGDRGDILLPRRYVTDRMIPGDIVDVFVYRDSEDRLVATTETPHAMVGDFAFLKVVSWDRNMGAFLDWGLPKDLLLPRREQASSIRPDDWIVCHNN